MSARRFMINCREQGMDMDMENAEHLRDVWVNTAFPEMIKQLKPIPMHDTRSLMEQYGVDMLESDDEDDGEDDSGGKDLYTATLVNGMVRNRCTYCAACNVQSIEAEVKLGELLEA